MDRLLECDEQGEYKKNYRRKTEGRGEPDLRHLR